MTAVYPDNVVLPGSVSNNLRAQVNGYTRNNSSVSKSNIPQKSRNTANVKSGISRSSPTPPFSKMPKIPGYETITSTPESIPPPLNPNIHQLPAGRKAIKNFENITKEQAKRAAILYASNKLCYGNNAAKEMEIESVSMSSTFQYTLETFTEKREVAWCYKPYSGLPLDTPLNGNAPLPWDISIVPKDSFIEGKESKEIPHTACEIQCHLCDGKGKSTCHVCRGNGQIDCNWCVGKARRFGGVDDSCKNCDGTGEEECIECNGSGQEICKACLAKKKLKFFLQLNVIWSTHKDEFALQETSLPLDMIKDATGQVSFEEESTRVWPIDHFHEATINQASNNLITRHSRQFPNEKILKQRHSIRTIPVAKVRYHWKDCKGEYYLYDVYCRVYFPDYPQPYCGGCRLL